MINRPARLTAIAAAAALLSLTLVACANPSATPAAGTAEKPTIIFAQAANSIAFSAAVTKSFEAAANEAGFQVSVLDNEADAAKAVANARTAAVQKPAVFIEYNLHPESNAQVSKIMSDAKVPVMGVQYQVEGAPLFAIDNKEVGGLGGTGLAEAAIQRFGDGAVKKVMILNFPEGGPVNIDRGKGAEEAVKKLMPDVEIVQGADKNDTAVAAQVVNAFLVSNPDQKLGIWCHLDQYSMAAVNAARAAGREDDIVIASTGGEKTIIPEISKQDSPIVGTTSLFPDTWGPEIVDLAKKVIAGESVPPLTKPKKVLFVDSTNVDEYYK